MSDRRSNSDNAEVLKPDGSSPIGDGPSGDMAPTGRGPSHHRAAGSSDDAPDLGVTNPWVARGAALRFTLVASSVVLALLADHFIRSGESQWAVAPLVIAVACFAMAAVRWSISSECSTAPSGAEQDPQTPKGTPSLGRLPLYPGSTFRVDLTEKSLGTAAALCAAALMYISLRNFGHVQRESLTLAWYSFGIAVTLALAAIPTIDERWTTVVRRLRRSQSLRIGFRDAAPWLIVAAILALAAGLRLYNLEDIPAGLWYDEADNTFQARQYARDPGQTPVYAPSTNLPTLFLLPISAVIKLAGVHITTPRLVAVVFGLSGIVATYLFVRHALGTSPGLFAAFILAVMRWDIGWSRIGMHGISGVLFAALSGWLTLVAVRSGRTSDYALAGAALGLGMWFYAPFRMFPLVLGFILLLHLLIARPTLRRFLANTATMALVAVFVAAPVIQYAAAETEEFFDRTRTTSLFNITPREEWVDRLWTNTVEHVLMFNHEGDPNPRHNLPNAPMLDRVTGALFIVGFFFALTRWRTVALVSLPIWVLLMILPGILTVPWESPQSLRSILVVPAVAALAALTADRLWRSLRQAPWARVRGLALPGILALLALIAYLNVDLYFGQQADDPRVYAAFSTDETLMARSHVEQQRLGYSLWVSRQFLFGLTSTLLANHPRLQVVAAPETLPLDSTQVWRGAAAYFEPREEGFWHVMRAYYPDAEYRSVTAPAGTEPLFYTGFVSRQKLADRQGLDADYMVDGEEVEGRRGSVLQSSWQPELGPEEYPYRVELHGSLHIPEFGEYEFVLDSPHAIVKLNDRQILDSGSVSAKIVLATGLHSISIVGEVEGPDDSIRLLWTGAEGDPEPVPFERLFRGSVRSIGLAGQFFKGEDTSGVPDAMEVTPTMDLFRYTPVIEEPYTAVWEGSIQVDTPGSIRFGVGRTGTGSVSLAIDGRLIAQNPPDGEIGTESELNLVGGDHLIRVEYRHESGPSQFEVMWAPGGGALRQIPVELMTPAPQRMMHLTE